jgi:hypothetical protein
MAGAEKVLAWKLECSGVSVRRLSAANSDLRLRVVDGWYGVV